MESARSRQIQRLMLLSIFLSVVTMAIDGVTIFVESFFIIPGAGVFTVAHHVTVLALTQKQRKRNAAIATTTTTTTPTPATPATIAADLDVTAKLGTIVCAWLLFLTWLAAVIMMGIVIAIVWSDKRFQHRQPQQPTVTLHSVMMQLAKTVLDSYQYDPLLLRQIQRLMFLSIFLSVVIMAIDGVTIFTGSLFVSPGAGVLTIAHHVTVLALAQKQRKRNAVNATTSSTPSPTTPTTIAADLDVTAKLGTIICAWLLFFTWLAAIILMAIIIAIVVPDSNGPGIGTLIAALVFAVLEEAVMLAIAIKCTRERRRGGAEMRARFEIVKRLSAQPSALVAPAESC
ncbi:uncharacterized protein LACBIDRAFT_293613 [Laccaria bicolor S238N-H82]|uniref:Predicted protein n=1 Tax=Laccaria bicolor (strain S238N-H82 / ATCC MYA-4686) TaxID=486041 RepID=B0D4L6_LACBS|nr:uncharacterized protein LACBIDRAFT_293613 [Laccaria bicolor S238N-H82]EDR10367.1 predicted protein [Laccaria bicolor S238N-H82]|eukprot:XP_001878817.1 predicted protein [Laccaria bicolor S238N-H82]